MKPYKSLFEKIFKQPLYEMAILDEKDSGISEGYIRIGFERRHPKLAYIHYFHAISMKDKEYVKFTINSDLEKIVMIENKMNITGEEINKIKKFISKNSDLLSNYYFQVGDTILTRKFIQALKHYDE